MKNKRIKFNLKKKIAKTPCAFLNSSGGSIYFGIKDDKTIVGMLFNL